MTDRTRYLILTAVVIVEVCLSQYLKADPNQLVADYAVNHWLQPDPNSVERYEQTVMWEIFNPPTRPFQGRVILYLPAAEKGWIITYSKVNTWARISLGKVKHIEQKRLGWRAFINSYTKEK